MLLPVAVLAGSAIIRVVHQTVAFVGPAGNQHPREAWELWTPADWAAMCPGWTVVPLIDTAPVEAGKRAVQRPMAGWTISADAVTVTYELVNLTLAEIAAHDAALADLLKGQVAKAVQGHLDATVQARGYENIATCVTYADEPTVLRFQAEGRAARAWRSAVWAACYATLDAVLAGARAPLTPEEMVAELPVIVWEE